MQVDRVKRNTTYIVSMMQFYHGLASSSIVPPQSSSPFQLLAWPPAAPEQPMDPADYLISDDDEHPTF